MGVAVSDYYSHFISLTLFNVAQYGHRACVDADHITIFALPQRLWLH